MLRKLRKNDWSASILLALSVAATRKRPADSSSFEIINIFSRSALMASGDAGAPVRCVTSVNYFFVLKRIFYSSQPLRRRFFVSPLKLSKSSRKISAQSSNELRQI